MEANKIQTRAYFTGNALYHPAYKDFASNYNNLKSEFRNADLATRGSVFLGTYLGLTDEKINYIKDTVDNFFKEFEK